MPIFSAQKLRLWIPGSLDESSMRLQRLMEDKSAASSGLSFLPGDLRGLQLEMRWQPAGRRQANLVIEGELTAEFSGSWLNLEISLAPTQQVMRLLWLGFTGLLFFIFLFGPPPPWTSLIPLGALFMMYFSQEQSFNDSLRQFRALLCEKLEAEYEEGGFEETIEEWYPAEEEGGDEEPPQRIS